MKQTCERDSLCAGRARGALTTITVLALCALASAQDIVSLKEIQTNPQGYRDKKLQVEITVSQWEEAGSESVSYYLGQDNIGRQIPIRIRSANGIDHPPKVWRSLHRTYGPQH